MKYLSANILIVMMLCMPFTTSIHGAQNGTLVNEKVETYYYINRTFNKDVLTKPKNQKRGRLGQTEDPRILLKQATRLAIVSLIMIPLIIFGGFLLIPIFSILSLRKIKKAKNLLKDNMEEGSAELMKKAAIAQTLAVVSLIAFAGIGIAFLNWLFNGL